MEKRTSEERDTLFHFPLPSFHFLNKKVDWKDFNGSKRKNMHIWWEKRSERRGARERKEQAARLGLNKTWKSRFDSRILDCMYSPWTVWKVEKAMSGHGLNWWHWSHGVCRCWKSTHRCPDGGIHHGYYIVHILRRWIENKNGISLSACLRQGCLKTTTHIPFNH